MEKKTKHLRIRITEAQALCLATALIKEQRNKSKIIRDALNNYLVENTYRDDNKEKK